jgi:cytosine/adenosine deaminase-related metal-dependent hydrolase
MSRIENDKRMLPSLPLGTKERARKLVERCIAHGTAHLRTHVDIHRETGLAPLEDILALREECEGQVTIQIVAFPQGGVMRAPGVIELMDEAIGMGADLVGGLDPAEIDRDPSGQLDAIFALAERRGVGLDIHLHEPGELGLFDLEEICRRAKAHGMQGKVTVSHGFCLSMVAESKAQRAAETMGEAGVMLATMGGSGTTVPPVMLLREAGVTVFAGNDDIRDTWSPYGTADMLERVSIIGWKCDLRHDELLGVAFELASTAGAKALGIEKYGVVEGAPASFFTLAADGIAEAVGGHPPRKLVVLGGKATA